MWLNNTLSYLRKYLRYIYGNQNKRLKFRDTKLYVRYLICYWHNIFNVYDTGIHKDNFVYRHNALWLPTYSLPFIFFFLSSSVVPLCSLESFVILQCHRCIHNLMHLYKNIESTDRKRTWFFEFIWIRLIWCSLMAYIFLSATFFCSLL